MDLPIAIQTKNSKLLSFSCPNCDSEIIRKIAQLLLPSLATAIIDSNFFFPSSSILTINTRKEMIDFLLQNSESHIPNLLLSHPISPNTNPLSIITTLISEFAFSKRSIISNLSSFVLPDSRDERIEELIREMDSGLFWTMDRREAIAEKLLRNVDYKNEWHCGMRFGEEDEMEAHSGRCEFRPVRCGNEGCKARFRKAREETHDGVCGYKVLGCEQRCGELVARREMDRHCVTVCGMKLMNCPFYRVGCESGVARCRVEEHCRDGLRRHLVCVMKIVCGDEEMSDDACEEHAKAVEEAQQENELAKAMNVRALVTAIKNLEANMKGTDFSKVK